MLRSGKTVLFTDGGALTNPGPGGYGVVLRYQDGRQELSGGFRLTTNNRMELMACIAGLSALPGLAGAILFSHSSYVVNGITKGWARRWQSRALSALHNPIYVHEQNRLSNPGQASVDYAE